MESKSDFKIVIATGKPCKRKEFGDLQSSFEVYKILYATWQLLRQLQECLLERLCHLEICHLFHPSHPSFLYQIFDIITNRPFVISDISRDS